MSEIKVDTVGPRVDNGTLTIGAAGDTVNIAGTAGTGFPAGTTINNNADNRVITGSGTAGTLNGETNFIYNGTIVGAGAAGAGADLGAGLHVKSADSGASSVGGGADELVLENSGTSGLTILSGTSNPGNIYFGDSGNSSIGYISYTHNGDYMAFQTNGSERIRILSSGGITFNGDTATANALDDYEEGSWTPNWSASGSGGGSVTGASTNIANYVKIGNQVTVSIYAIIQSTGTFTDYRITNLPFTQLVSGAGSAVEIGQTGTAWLVQGSAGGGTFYSKQYNAGFYINPYLQICYTYVTS